MTTELRRDILFPLIVLMTILVVTVMGTVALLGRMAPAIERIVTENLYSLEAVEAMTVAVCQGDRDGATERFKSALARAKNKVTESSERVPLAALTAQAPAAFGGNAMAREEVLSALLDLAAINRAAVVRQDERARALGYAGAWGTVFLGSLAFAWALIAVGRARRRLINPLHEISDVLDAAHAGDHYRRCRGMPAPAEIKKMMSGVDELLDVLALRAYSQQPSLRATVDRQVLLYFLEQSAGPAWVVTASGSLDAANRAGLALLADASDKANALRQRLTAAVEGDVPADMQVTAIEGTDRFLCQLTVESEP